jgi:hypothetical protein
MDTLHKGDSENDDDDYDDDNNNIDDDDDDDDNNNNNNNNATDRNDTLQKLTKLTFSNTDENSFLCSQIAVC